MKPNRSTVLILSSDPAFSREITANWPQDAGSPEFIVLEQDLCRELQRDAYDLAIADGSVKSERSNLREALAASGKPAIVIDSDLGPDLCRTQGLILELRREPCLWAAVTGLVAREILRRVEAESCIRGAEKRQAAAESEATLGRYMVEMRHTTNNSLTSILGNAELLLLEPGLSARVLAQVDTIRNMALRLHEVFQRFSSIEKELSVVARESGKGARQAGAASGA